ncbi:hypothetical protein [Nostoc sp. DedQUE09]|uniref:hypothetical protein n=1 Tax=Nostoc sp. DedQUE09 TaxID=3075394 RepID=UPI002AD26756|nr:hypothetical protein [Nostoc sp. DedQUE09]MDZ7950919.1 hypothetical protein [Nostoc sp. DedQUE09]
MSEVQKPHPQPPPRKRGYGVHTSREIPPDTWFRPLAVGLCDRSESLSLRSRSVS